jgi:glutamate N-acetyltransferase / amino-acid N-acetyltransferase
MKIKGFSFSAVAAGIKYKNRLDLGLIYSDKPVVTAGVFTTNLVKAAPVVLDMQRLEKGVAQTVLVNSGCANACTGEPGMEVARKSSALVASKLGIDEELVQVSSTGVIGELLNLNAIENIIDDLVGGLSPNNFEKVAEAIMTTDTVSKTAFRTVHLGGKEVQLMGMSKGSGMIMPNMATMLAFVVTDANISYPELQRCLQKSVSTTFNRITVDGDTSTNDMVLIMANGAAGNTALIEDNCEETRVFQEVLEDLLKDLALQIVVDGEGATKKITIRVSGARNSEEAEKMARVIGTSNLVKTAFFGEDANWGRIIAAMGRSGVDFDPERVEIGFGDITLVDNGRYAGAKAEEAATALLREKDILLRVDLQQGEACEEVYTCDFSLDYVKINADYRT